MPAKASEPPDGISTVVSARRVLIEGMVCVWPRCAASVMALSLESSETSLITLRLMRPSDRTIGVKFRPTPNFLNWIWVWQMDGCRVAGEAGRDREFAAGQEVRGFAGDRSQVGLRQRAYDAGTLHGAQASR